MLQSVLRVSLLLSVARAAMRGVDPAKQAMYGGATFKCFDGKAEVPAKAVNDEFCDCVDGSDEPGTGACAGQDQTLFHCANEGATPMLLYASRVDDGVCDCCDGSDEAGLSARRPGNSCTNRCVEEGMKDLTERRDRMQKLTVGLEKKAQIIASAEVDRTTWKNDIAKLESELPALEAVLEEAKKEEAANAKDGDTAGLRAEVDALKKTVAALEKEVADLKAKLEAATIGGEANAADIEKPAEEKKVVSEYAKWMENAGSTPGAIDSPAEDATEEDELEDHPGPTKPVATNFGGNKASEAVTEAQNKVRDNKDAAKSLQKKLDQMSSDDKLGFASLIDKCLTKHDGQYTYKVCFFENANQDSVLLGRWSGWTGPKQAKFANGHMCPGGPERDLNVVFECGDSEEVLDVSEPSRCSYEAHISHPGACSEEDMAALEKPPVKHPKDEL
uniref:Glucosidase 2 subunit beta n=1 Tax=Alexandrium catenella TaxID=2925 RepID=A0A7S1W8K1_ALECA